MEGRGVKNDPKSRDVISWMTFSSKLGRKYFNGERGRERNSYFYFTSEKKSTISSTIRAIKDYVEKEVLCLELRG